MKVEEYQERKLIVDGWDLNLSSYRLGSEWHCKADNVSPGAALCRTTGPTREEAEGAALVRAVELLGQTKRHTV